MIGKKRGRSKRIAHFIRGICTILEIAPDPYRGVTKPLYKRRGETPEQAIYRTWSLVGDSLIAASGMTQRESAFEREVLIDEKAPPEQIERDG